MPGVYTTALNTQPQTVQPKTFPKNPKVVSSEKMDVHSKEEMRDSTTSSPLIDLTSSTPSPPSPSITSHKPALQQLASYASSAQTRVKTTVSPIQTTPVPAMDNPLEHTSPSPTVSTQQITRNSIAEPTSATSSSLLSSISMLPAPSDNSTAAVGAPATTVAATAVPTTAVASPSTLQPSPTTVTVASKATPPVDNPPPALVEYINPPPVSKASEDIDKPALHVKSELGQFNTHLVPGPSLSSHAKGNTNMVRGPAMGSQEIVTSPSESSVPQPSAIDITSTALPPKVGVVLPEPPVTSDFPPLRMKCVDGEEEGDGAGQRRETGATQVGENVDREEEEDEEEGDSIMELRIEDSVVEADNRRAVVTNSHRSASPVRRGVAGNAVTLVEECSVSQAEEDLMESESNSNSIGTSPSPSVGVRGHVQPVVVESTETRSRLAVVEGEAETNMVDEMARGHSQREGRCESTAAGVPVKFSKYIHGSRSLVSHNSCSSPLLVQKGTVATVSPSLLRDNDRGPEDGGYRVARRDKGMVPLSGHNGDIVGESYRVRKVAKVKQFFTTLQHFGNRISSEVADQVQELITALVNGTATIEEFHQEIQTVTNHPLRQFIIPFLRENLDLFREELRDSEQALSDILCHPPSSSPQTTISVTPQMIDDDLPVLPSSKPPLTPTLTSHNTLSVASPSLPLTAEPATHVSSLQVALTNTTNMQRNAQSQTHPAHVVTTMTFEPPSDSDSAHNSPAARKRQRHTSTDKAPVSSQEMHAQTTISDKSMSSVKRARHDHSHSQAPVSMDTVAVSSTARRGPIPAYPYPPTLTPHQHTPSHSPHNVGLSHPHTSTHSPGHTPSAQVLHTSLSARKQLVADDLANMDRMLSSVVGMVEKVCNAMTILRERVLNANSDLEKREEQQRLAEATEKARRLWQEEKLHIQREANKKLKETVAQVRAEMEQKIAQAQSLAVQETLKEANTQSNSKESCWNCGRRATETCSGCNKARYCGTFCQHKDWGNHMHQCASGIVGMSEEQSTGNSGNNTQRVIIQSGDARMTSLAAEEPPDIKPRISPEQLMSIPQITVRYPVT